MENPRAALKLFWIVLASMAVGVFAAFIFHLNSK